MKISGNIAERIVIFCAPSKIILLLIKYYLIAVIQRGCRLKSSSTYWRHHYVVASKEYLIGKQLVLRVVESAFFWLYCVKFLVKLGLIIPGFVQ